MTVPWYLRVHGTAGTARWHRRQGLKGRSLRQVCWRCADAENRQRQDSARRSGKWGNRPITGRSKGYRNPKQPR